MPTNSGSPSHLYNSPEAPQLQQRQVKSSSSSSIFVNTKYTDNSYHHVHHHQQIRNCDRNPPTPHYIKQKQTSSPRLTHSRIGKVDTYDSPDSQGHSYAIHTDTTERSNKKRKQSGNDAPMEIYDDSPACYQSRSHDYYIQSNTNTNTNTNSNSNTHSSTSAITNEAQRFATSRYPFPPFILKFNAGKINDKAAIEELLNYSKINFSFDLDLVGFRTSSIRCNSNECNLLIFVKNSSSFSFLYSDIKWPDRLFNETFTIDKQPSIPPQLAVIITNVSYKIDFTDFENELRNNYANVLKVIRLKNKDQYDTKIVKVEFSSSKTRDEILSNGHMVINYVKYDVKEYLPQATILICTKCFGVGHFRKQCKQTDDTCKVCSERCPDINKHNCSGIAKCLHCGGDHYSNDMKCKVVKQYRADLTKILLSSSNKSFNNYRCNNMFTSISEFPPLPRPTKSTINGYKMPVGEQNGIMIKLDQILNSINNINVTIGDLVKRTEQIEDWINAKQKFDLKINNVIRSVQHGISRHDGVLFNKTNVIDKLILPAMDDIMSMLPVMNVKEGRALNVDFESRSGVWKNQLQAYREKRLHF
ncbi:unnamed protein product [Rotaria sp. Silwood1]|nr:unnamed protein product [Rotaria sp. Silwood1]